MRNSRSIKVLVAGRPDRGWLPTGCRRVGRLLITVTTASLILSFGSAIAVEPDPEPAANEKRIVDCLLPGQVRTLGGRTYLTPRQPALLPGVECNIRGGEYLLYDRANAVTSLGEWLKLADEGDTQAQIYVGEIFQRGMLGEPDYIKAAQWFETASRSGSTAATLKLAYLYENGLGVQLDRAKAQELYADALGEYGGTLDPGTLPVPADDGQELQSMLEMERQQKAQLQAQLNATSAQLESTQELLQKMKLRLREQGALDSMSANQRQEQEILIGQLQADLEREQQRADAYQNQISEISEREQQLSGLQSQLIDQQQRIGELEQNIALSETRLVRTRSELSVRQEQYAAAVAQLEADREAADSDSELLDSASKSLAIRQDENQKQRRQIDELKEQIQAAEQQSSAYQDTLAALEAERSRLRLAQAEVVKERNAREVVQDKLTTVGNQLKATETQLTDQQNYAKALGDRITKLQDERLAEMQNNESSSKKAVAALNESIADQQQLLTKKQDEIDLLKNEIDLLTANQTRYDEQFRANQRATASVALAGPTIELIQPLFTRTRGITTVPTISTSGPTRQLIGRVNAPAGVLSVTVNNMPQKPNEHGVFKTLIATSNGQTPVTIVAIDNQGKRDELAIQLAAAFTEEPAGKPKLPKVNFGRYHALLIGNNSYRYMPDLRTAINDVEAISTTLKEKYGFNTIVVRNATRAAIFDALYDLHEKMTPEDNLLIYYAGHGDYVEGTGRGVWLPTDARRDNPGNWVSNIEVSDYLMQIRAKQVIVIADSCYSGALTRSALTNIKSGMNAKEYAAWLDSMSDKISRTALTSGGLKPTLDGGGGRYSVFANALLKILGDNDDVLAGQDLWQMVSAQVVYAAGSMDFEQEPEYAPIDSTGHEGGDFFFIPRTRL